MSISSEVAAIRLVLGMHSAADMGWRDIAAVWGLCLLGCGPDFTEAGGRAEFRSSLSRRSHRWTPAAGVALGSTFTLERSDCLFCPPLRLDGGTNFFGNHQVLTSTSTGALAVGEGTQLIEYRGPDGFSFPIRVEAPASLSLHDPLALSRDLYSYLGTIDGGAWPAFPDVGEEVVMGADAGLLLDIFARGTGGGLLGSSAIFAARGETNEVTASTLSEDGRLVELISGPSGSGGVTVSLLDGGLERTWPVRIADADEAAQLELVALPPVMGRYIIRALVTRGDGGAFLEPPVEWTFSREVVRIAYWDPPLHAARERREVSVISDSIADAGVVTVTARVGSLVASVDLELEDLPPPRAPTPPMPTGCGCTSVEAAPLLMLALIVSLRRPRRARLD